MSLIIGKPRDIRFEKGKIIISGETLRQIQRDEQFNLSLPWLNGTLTDKQHERWDELKRILEQD